MDDARSEDDVTCKAFRTDVTLAFCDGEATHRAAHPRFMDWRPVCPRHAQGYAKFNYLVERLTR